MFANAPIGATKRRWRSAQAFSLCDRQDYDRTGRPRIQTCGVRKCVKRKETPFRSRAWPMANSDV